MFCWRTSFTITFTNTRTPEAGPLRPSSHSHKRGAHSISSAPLARPPTSPGTPRSATTPSIPRAKPVDELPRQKNLIEKPKPPPALPQSSEEIPNLIEQRRKKQLAPKSLSVSISPFELENTGGDFCSTFAEDICELAKDTTYTFSSCSYRRSRIGLQPPPCRETLCSRRRAFTGHPLRQPLFLHFHTSTAPRHPHAPRTAFASSFPPTNNELILYSDAQLTGTVPITPVPGTRPAPEQARTLNGFRAVLLSRKVLGGGCMDITASLNAPVSPKPRTS